MVAFNKELLERIRASDLALTELNVGAKTIDDDGVCALADALQKNLTLTWLHLRNNNIGNDGARALADALQNNSTLTLLNLGRNEIGDENLDEINTELDINRKRGTDWALKRVRLGQVGRTTKACRRTKSRALMHV